MYAAKVRGSILNLLCKCEADSELGMTPRRFADALDAALDAGFGKLIYLREISASKNGTYCGLIFHMSSTGNAEPENPRNDSHRLARGQFLGSLCGFYYGFNQRDSELAFFEFHDAVDSAAGGGGDGVFEKSGMIASFKHDGGRAERGLGGEQSRDIAGQANLHTGFG